MPKVDNIEFKQWISQNVINHKIKGYSVVMISLKPPGKPPGDMNAIQMNELSQLSHEYSFGEIRVTHEQNILMPHVENKKIYDLWLKLKKIGLSTPNIGLISDIICCPGMDYCALATARSIPISQKISHSFNNYGQQKNIGDQINPFDLITPWLLLRNSCLMTIVINDFIREQKFHSFLSINKITSQPCLLVLTKMSVVFHRFSMVCEFNGI